MGIEAYVVISEPQYEGISILAVFADEESARNGRLDIVRKSECGIFNPNILHIKGDGAQSFLEPSFNPTLESAGYSLSGEDGYEYLKELEAAAIEAAKQS